MATSSEPTLGDLLNQHTDISFSEPTPPMNHKGALLAVVITLMLLTWICVVFRLYTRLVVARVPWWDDLLVALSLIMTTACSTATAIASGPDLGLGQHLLNITPTTFTNFMHLFYVMNSTYLTATALIKLSLLFQYLRLFARDSRARLVCKILIGVVAVWSLIFCFIGWFPCFPPSYYWENPTSDTCYGYGVGLTHPDRFAATLQAHSATNTIIDLAIFALPLPLFLGGAVTTRTKLGLAALLAGGALISALAIWRLATLIQHQAGMFPSKDPTWYAPVTIVLSVLEVNLAAICASIPVFWPVLEHQFGKIFITQEVQITSEVRWQPNLRDDQSESELTMRRELSHNHSISGGNEGRRPGSGGGRDFSDPEILKPGSTTQRSLSGRERYYDDFMMDQIDPLRERKGSTPHAQAVSQSQNRGRRKWWRLV